MWWPTAMKSNHIHKIFSYRDTDWKPVGLLQQLFLYSFICMPAKFTYIYIYIRTYIYISIKKRRLSGSLKRLIHQMIFKKYFGLRLSHVGMLRRKSHFHIQDHQNPRTLPALLLPRASSTSLRQSPLPASPPIPENLSQMY